MLKQVSRFIKSGVNIYAHGRIAFGTGEQKQLMRQMRCPYTRIHNNLRITVQFVFFSQLQLDKIGSGTDTSQHIVKIMRYATGQTAD